MSISHWVVVLLIVLVLFGAGRLSDLGKGLGEGIKNFKKGLADDRDDGRGVPAGREPAAAPAKGPPNLGGGDASNKLVRLEIGEDDDDQVILRKLAAKRAAQKASRDD
jgi:sec-independent protein translocase protein TatA